MKPIGGPPVRVIRVLEQRRRLRDRAMISAEVLMAESRHWLSPAVRAEFRRAACLYVKTARYHNWARVRLLLELRKVRL